MSATPLATIDDNTSQLPAATPFKVPAPHDPKTLGSLEKRANEVKIGENEEESPPKKTKNDIDESVTVSDLLGITTQAKEVDVEISKV